MTRPRRRVSALAEQRLHTRLRVLHLPAELKVDPTLTDGDAPAVAYCPVLARVTNGATKMCASVHCGECPVLQEELDERAPDHTWVCSRCTEGLKAQPFWKDGPCEACGYESPVLMLAVPK